MKIGRLLLGGLLLLSVSASAEPQPAKTFSVGVSLPLSGKKEKSGRLILSALELGARRINEAAAGSGLKLELVVRDDQNDGELARKNAVEFARTPGVLAAIGHYDGAVALSALEVYDQEKLPIYSPTVGIAEYASKSPWSFSGTLGDDQQAELIAVYLGSIENAQKLLLIHTDSDYGTPASKAFLDKAAKLGLAVEELVYPEKAEKLPEDLLPQAVARAAGGAQAIVMFSHSVKGAEIIRGLRAQGVELPIYGGDRLATDLIEMLGPEASREVHVSFPFMFELAALEATEFQRGFRQGYQAEPSIWGAFAYDGLNLIAEAVREGAKDREGVRAFLAGLDSEEKAKEGLTGRLFFDEQGCMRRSPTMSRIRQEEFQPDYTQLKVVTSQHDLRQVDKKVAIGEMLKVDGVAYYKIQVVYVGVDYYRVNQVNPAEQNFDLEMFLWFRWTGDLEPGDITFTNEIFSEESFRNELRGDTGGVEKWQSFRAKGKFLYPYDLRRYPFDVQSLPLVLAHKNKNANKLQLVADRQMLSVLPVREIYPEEWKYLRRENYAGTFKLESNFGNPSYKKGQLQADYSQCHFELVVQRIIFPYLITLFLPLGIVIFIALLVMFIPRTEFEARINTVMTSLLSVLVFHMTQSESLPRLGYLSKADLLFMISYLFLFFLILKVFAVNGFMVAEKEDSARRLDRGFNLLFIPAVLAAYAFALMRA